MNTTFRLVCAIVLIASFSAVSNAQQSSLYVGTSPNFTRIESGGAGTIILPSGGGTLLAAGSPIPSGTAWNGSIITPSYGGLGIDLSSASVGSLLYVPTTAGTWATLPAGTLNYVLTSGGPNTAPSWQPAPGGGSSNIYSVGASVASPLGNNANVSGTSIVYFVSDNCTVNLPSASGNAGQVIKLIDVTVSFSAHGIIASAQTGQLVRDVFTGTNNQTSGNYETIDLISDGNGDWYLQQD